MVRRGSTAWSLVLTLAGAPAPAAAQGLQADGVVTILDGLFWLAATWLGLGAMVVAGRRYLDFRGGAASTGR